MGIGAEWDNTGGPDYDEGQGAVVYRLHRSRQDPGDHLPSPTVTRAQMSAIIDAALVSQSAWESHISANHSALWTWLQLRTMPQRAALRLQNAALRGL